MDEQLGNKQQEKPNDESIPTYLIHSAMQFQFLLFFILVASIQAFMIRVEQRKISSFRKSPFQLNGSREEEIAKLEEQLRRLKQEEETSREIVEQTRNLSDEDLQKFVADERVLEKIRGKDMLLSESDLIEAQILDKDEVSGNSNGILTSVIATVALAIFLFFFAQVPVGQEDLSRYSVTGSTASKTIDLGDMNPNKPQNR